MDTGRYLKVPDQPDSEIMDKYTASIELSNACRQFYKSRLEAAHCIKSRWERNAALVSTCCDDSDSNKMNDRLTDDSINNRSSAVPSASTTAPTPPKRQRNSIDEAMETLRKEMTSLMDQDLSLMKQLLTLNETIEELKWQRRYYYSRRSLPGSSTDIHHSDCSISDTEMYDSEDDSILTRTSLPSAKTSTTTTTTSTYQTPLMVLTPPTSSSSTSSSPYRKYGVAYGSGSGHVTAAHAPCGGVGEKRRGGCEVVTVGSDSSSVKVFHSEQDSFDSGFHEPSSEEEAVV